MNRKEVRKWLREHRATKERVDSLRKELESKDLPTLLSMVEVCGALLDTIKMLLIAEILRARGLVDQTKKG